MEKIYHSIHINAPREKVWDTMFDKETYREWTKPFNPSSSFEGSMEGSWEEGSEIRFIGKTEEGKEEGMYSRIQENRKHEYLSIEHLGMIVDGKVDTESEEVKKWTPAFENYTFEDENGGTKVSVDMDIAQEYKEQFEKMWAEALNKLKELAEK